MTADRLRAAARLMRERAEAAQSYWPASEQVVALAVADWLEYTADTWAHTANGERRHALAVADAYLTTTDSHPIPGA